MVREKHVDKAIEEDLPGKPMIEEKIQEMIDDGTILIDSDGAGWVRSTDFRFTTWGIMPSANPPGSRPRPPWERRGSSISSEKRT